jgi:ribosomal-protein-serine acetyltransferase
MEIVVRPLHEDDAEAMEAAYVASREHLRPWMPWAREDPMGIGARRAWIAEQNRVERAGGDRVRGAFLAAGGALLGTGGLHARIGPGALEIGYWVHVAWTRRGVATAMVHALCAEAFAEPGIEAVEIHHDAANAASGAVAAGAGFTHVEERHREPLAPADTTTERVGRPPRDQYRKRI